MLISVLMLLLLVVVVVLLLVLLLVLMLLLLLLLRVLWSKSLAGGARLSLGSRNRSITSQCSAAVAAAP